MLDDSSLNFIYIFPSRLCTMTPRPIDQHAVRLPQRSGLLPCLYVPVAARDANAIETYVGRIVQPLTPSSPSKALLVEAYEPDKLDGRLAIWAHPRAAVLHYPHQVWAHVDYNAYRRAYARAFPDVDLTCFVLDHVMNRRVAPLERIRVSKNCANLEAGEFKSWWSI